MFTCSKTATHPTVLHHSDGRIYHFSLWNISAIHNLTKTPFVLCFLVQAFDAVIEALEKGQTVDVRGLPPPPGQGKQH